MSLLAQHIALARADTAWSPRLIATQCWLDASDSSTLTLSGNKVDAWADKSGNGRHVAQAVAGMRPDLDPGARNGRNVIRFDGVDDTLEFVAAFAQTNGQNFWLAGDTTGINTAAGSDRIFLNRNYTNNEPALYLTRFAGDYSAHVWWGSYDSPGLSAGSGRPAIWRWRIRTSPSSRLVQIDGGTPRITTPGFTNLTTWAGINNTGVQVAKFAAYEIISTGDVDDATAQKIEGYLAWKWGMSANLPSGHPYKLAPPMA